MIRTIVKPNTVIPETAADNAINGDEIVCYIDGTHLAVLQCMDKDARYGFALLPLITPDPPQGTALKVSPMTFITCLPLFSIEEALTEHTLFTADSINEALGYANHLKETPPRVRMHNRETGVQRIVSSIRHCQDEAERTAFTHCIKQHESASVGIYVAEPYHLDA